MGGGLLETEVEHWNEGLPTYEDAIGVDDHAFVYMKSDIEVFGEVNWRKSIFCRRIG